MVFALTTLGTIAVPADTSASASRRATAVHRNPAVAPPGFQAIAALSGLNQPVAASFASDGRVFIAEKPGIVKVFASMNAPAPSVLVDLQTEVYSFLDHGLLGMALDPGFPSQPYIYLLFNRDSLTPGGPVPFWNDACPVTEGCVHYSRLVRYQISTNGTSTTAGARTVLADDWCEQFGSHGIGGIAFGADGMLYTGGGDGAAYTSPDWGQFGIPTKNPCGDPPGGAGTALTTPTSEGGSLRSQDARTTQDPTGLSGAIIRIDPTTGFGSPGNPFAASPDANQRRILAYGIRNPYRIAMRPGTNELYVGDVGWNYGDEIDRIANGAAAGNTNFGWPCYEGSQVLPAWLGLNANLCTSLYSATGTNAAINPAYEYLHSGQVVAGEPCPSGASALSGLAFATAGSYPARYNGGLFFSDYTRQCIWFAPADGTGRPDFSQRELFMQTINHYPVDLQVGPGGDLYYVDVVTGELMRIRYAPGNQSPVAAFTLDHTIGNAPLSIHADASGSTDADPGDTATLQFAWDLDGDGNYNDATGQVISTTFATIGVHPIGLMVTDALGAAATITHNVFVGDAPLPTITAPLTTTNWGSGEQISFSGQATDPQDGAVAPSQLKWDIQLHHCDTLGHCHAHHIQTINGVDHGSFIAPDHAFPAYLDIALTATDSDGITNTVTQRIDPRTTTLQIRTSPPGLSLLLDTDTVRDGQTTTLIASSQHVVSSPQSVTAWGSDWTFDHWSDGATTAHVVSFATSATIQAVYRSARPARYRIIGSDGATLSFGIGAKRIASGTVANFTAVSGASTPSATGWWRVDGQGRVVIGGRAHHYGDLRNVQLHQPVAGMIATPSGRGYLLVATDGGIFAFGDARFRGSLGARHLRQPIVAAAMTKTGRGYWLFAADGGVFSFGDARFHGSLASRHIRSPIVAGGSTTSGRGYWLLSSDGAVRAFGGAQHYSGHIHLRHSSAVAILATPTGNGYWVLDRAGRIHSFGDAPALGGAPNLHHSMAAIALTR